MTIQQVILELIERGFEVKFSANLDAIEICVWSTRHKVHRSYYFGSEAMRCERVDSLLAHTLRSMLVKDNVLSRDIEPEKKNG